MAQGKSQGTGQKSVREFRLADCDMRPATVDDIPAIVATLEAAPFWPPTASTSGRTAPAPT